MLMSADSSDSAKTSVICSTVGSNMIAPPAPEQPSTTAPPILGVTGRSHLENALKLPPNTSVSAYYQHNSKLGQMGQNYNPEFRSLVAPVTDLDTVPPTGVTMASSSNSPSSPVKLPHSSVIFVSKSSAVSTTTVVVQQQQAPMLQHFDSLPHHPQQQQQQQHQPQQQQLQQQQQQQHHLQHHPHPHSMYPHGYPQANLHHPGGLAVVPADSRPQTPEYIKSYPVMDTTVASSIKGEPELNIGEFYGIGTLGLLEGYGGTSNFF